MKHAQAGCIMAPWDLRPGAQSPLEAAVIPTCEDWCVDKMRGPVLCPYDFNVLLINFYNCYCRSHEDVGLPAPE